MSILSTPLNAEEHMIVDAHIILYVINPTTLTTVVWYPNYNDYIALQSWSESIRQHLKSAVGKKE